MQFNEPIYIPAAEQEDSCIRTMQWMKFWKSFVASFLEKMFQDIIEQVEEKMNASIQAGWYMRRGQYVVCE